jgi:HK97 family phage portal protein
LGIFDRFSQRSAVSVQFANDDSIFLGQTFANESVTNKNSVRLVPVWAAVQLVAGAVGSLPLHVYRTQPDGTRIETPGHPAGKLLNSPNAYMDGGELIETAMGHLLLWGNAFLLKVRGGNDNRVTELWPIGPDRVKVGKDKGGAPFYVLDGNKGPFTQREFIHIRGLSFDGLVGLSPIQMARQGLGTYAAVEKYAGKFWANNATPGGVLTHPNRLSPEAAERLRAQWHASHGGTGNASRVAILEEGMKFEPMSLPLDDAQMIQQMELSTLNVARLFQIPAHMLQTNANGSSLTYTTTSMEYEHFVRFTLRRWLARWEKSLMRDSDLLSTNGLGSQFSLKFDTTDLTRGDTKTIADINLALFKEGIVTRDEVRSDLGRGPIENVADAPADAPQAPSDATGASI